MSRIYRCLMNVERTQEFGPAALHEAQIRGVINRPREIRVFIIDADAVLVRRQLSLLFRKHPELRRGPWQLG
jgi:hypothetical protein